MGIFPYDIPGVAENALPDHTATNVAETLETYGYMESKPYPIALIIGLLPHRNEKWVGYRNTHPAIGITDDNAYIMPKIPISPRPNNAAQTPWHGGTYYSGQAPAKGIFTGVSDDTNICR